jgi:hypothetical protein
VGTTTRDQLTEHIEKRASGKWLLFACQALMNAVMSRQTVMASPVFENYPAPH